jgi:hypothetical protein
MKVFYFCSPTGVKILENLEIKITRPSEFNDPLEFYPYPDISDPPSENDKRRCEAFHKTGAEFFHFLCFSRNFKNPRMWAQYATNHSGLMFELDLQQPPFRQFREGNGGLVVVNYRKKKRVPLSVCLKSGSERFKMISSRKGRAWEGEEEVRLMIPRGLDEDGLIQTRELIFGERLLTLLKVTEKSIVSVTTGLRASEDLSYTVKRLLETRFTNASLYRARCHLSGFTMVRELVNLTRRPKVRRNR